MSRHLPAVSGRKLVRALHRAGFVVLRQKGSHVALEKRTAEGYWRTIVPMHREIRPTTLSDIPESDRSVERRTGRDALNRRGVDGFSVQNG